MNIGTRGSRRGCVVSQDPAADCFPLASSFQGLKGSIATHKDNARIILGNLERAMGFEPTTPTLARLCSAPDPSCQARLRATSFPIAQGWVKQRAFAGRTLIRQAVYRQDSSLVPSGCVNCRRCTRSAVLVRDRLFPKSSPTIDEWKHHCGLSI
jgi:hypothetical protein